MKKLAWAVLVGVLICGCGEEEKKEAPKTGDATVNEIADSIAISAPIAKEAPIAYELLDSSVAGTVRKLDSIYGKTPYYTAIEGVLLFYICKGNWNEPTNGMAFNNLMGITDEGGSVILEPNYNKIYNPDATVKNYIEVEIKGKRGLFNYDNGTLIEPVYNVIFPSSDPAYLAIGKKGNEHFYILKDGKEKLIDDLAKVPAYISGIDKWSFDIKSKNIKLLYDTYETTGGDVGAGVVFTPSYLHHLGFMPEVYQQVMKDNRGDAGIISSQGKIIKSVSITDKIVALISYFYEEGISGRDYQVNRYNVITVDAKNNVLGNEVFLETEVSRYGDSGENDYRFLSKNLMEVGDFGQSKDYSKYDEMTIYKFYEVKENGEIAKLESPRVFDFTKFAAIDESYFQGVFLKHRSYEELADEEAGNVLHSVHLDLEDLDLMRNEIYAEYGLIFKSEKWNEYFKKQAWYAPKYDNVDKFLSEKDKANVKVILQMKEKMTGKEQQFTQKQWTHVSAAG